MKKVCVFDSSRKANYETLFCVQQFLGMLPIFSVQINKFEIHNTFSLLETKNKHPFKSQLKLTVFKCNYNFVSLYVMINTFSLNSYINKKFNKHAILKK